MVRITRMGFGRFPKEAGGIALALRLLFASTPSSTKPLSRVPARAPIVLARYWRSLLFGSAMRRTGPASSATLSGCPRCMKENLRAISAAVIENRTYKIGVIFTRKNHPHFRAGYSVVRVNFLKNGDSGIQSFKALKCFR
jgi:hypothetical protein